MREFLTLGDLQELTFPLQEEEQDKLEDAEYRRDEVKKAEKRLAQTTHTGSRQKQTRDLVQLNLDFAMKNDSFLAAKERTDALLACVDAYVQLNFERLLEEAIADAADNGYDYELPASDSLAAGE